MLASAENCGHMLFKRVPIGHAAVRATFAEHEHFGGHVFQDEAKSETVSGTTP